jgi:hypothetical protein
MTEKLNVYRQGEVLLTQILKKNLPKKLKQKDNILAHGTVTGHSHSLDNNAKTYLDPETGIQYVTASKPTQLTHEEHADITIAKGTYKVTIQREYDILRDEIRAVRD